MHLPTKCPCRKQNIKTVNVHDWIGKTVICVDPTQDTSPERRQQLVPGQRYVVIDAIEYLLIDGRYEDFVYLNGFPREIYSNCLRRNIKNCFSAKAFVLDD